MLNPSKLASLNWDNAVSTAFDKGGFPVEGISDSLPAVSIAWMIDERNARLNHWTRFRSRRFQPHRPSPISQCEHDAPVDNENTTYIVTDIEKVTSGVAARLEIWLLTKYGF